MSEQALPIGDTGFSLRSIQQTTTAGTVQTEVVTDTQLTLTVPDKSTVGAASAELIAATTGIRDVIISIPSTASIGICINFDAAATANKFLIEPGGVFKARTAQQIRAIRAGGVDVTAYVITGVPP